MTLDEYEPLSTVESKAEIRRNREKKIKRANCRANNQHLLLLQTVITLIPFMLGVYTYGSFNIVVVVIAIALGTIELPVVVIFI